MVSLGFTLITCPEVIAHEFGYCLMCFEMGLMDLVIASWGFVTASWVLWMPHETGNGPHGFGNSLMGLEMGLLGLVNASRVRFRPHELDDSLSWVRIWTSWVWRLPHGLGNLSHRTKWVWQSVLFNIQYTIYQCCGSKYIKFRSGTWILVQFVSQFKRKM